MRIRNPQTQGQAGYAIHWLYCGIVLWGEGRQNSLFYDEDGNLIFLYFIIFDNFADHLGKSLVTLRELASGQCSIIKMEEGSDNPMLKATDKVAEAFVLFAQVLPLFLSSSS